MNGDTANNGVIVGEPMSTIPTTPSKPSNLSFSSTSRPSTPISTYTPLSTSKSDALKANPHPYPIRTTSTAVLSRSNSTASTVNTAHHHQYHYQYYVPQSPSKESPSSNNVEGTRRGGRHRYSKSLVDLDSRPKALSSPSSSSTTTTTTTLFSHRNLSMSSLSSSESDSPTKSEEEDEEENEEEGDSITGNKKKRGRRAVCRGGKVRGIVASFEGRSGPEDGKEEGSRQYDYSVKYRRKRTESDASSVSSASSFGSFTDVRADDGGARDSIKLESKGNADAKLRSDSTPKRNNVEKEGTQQRRHEEEEPTIEELLASTAGIDPIPEEGTVYDETVKLHSADVAYSTVTASSIRYSLPIPTFSSLAIKRNSKSAMAVPNSTDPDDELSVEELLALVSNSETGSGASAWERDDVGCCTVKRVGDVGRLEEKNVVQDSAEGSSTLNPPDDELVVRQVSPTNPVIATTTGGREVELEQEMSETREMVRALSARVASVEAKIGEMEVVAGDLEVRGRQLLEDHNNDGDDDDDNNDDNDNDQDKDDIKPPPQEQSLPLRVASTLFQTVFGGVGIGVSLVKMVLPFSSLPSSRSSPKTRSRETSQTRAVLPMWYKRSWACYLLFLGLGACAFVLREVVRRGMMLRGRRT